MELVHHPIRNDAGQSPMVVAVDGSPADRSVLIWAAEEASQLGRPLVISHAVGHLPPGLGYAAAWVAREVSGLTVDTVVRLLEPSALLPVVGRGAYAVAQADPAWLDVRQRRGPVVAALRGPDNDAQVIAYATDYARRRGVDLEVLTAAAGRAVQKSPRDAGLTLVAAPGREPSHDRARVAWEAATTATRVHGPVVRVGGAGRDDA
jgi:hypothetical protein